jgi:hypothetical protein
VFDIEHNTMIGRRVLFAANESPLINLPLISLSFALPQLDPGINWDQ